MFHFDVKFLQLETKSSVPVFNKKLIFQILLMKFQILDFLTANQQIIKIINLDVKGRNNFNDSKSSASAATTFNYIQVISVSECERMGFGNYQGINFRLRMYTPLVAILSWGTL